MTQSPHLTALPRRGPAAIRIGDTERDRTCEVLATHFAEGRLTPAELDERTGRAVEAVTQHDLLVLTQDLPAVGLGTEQFALGRAHPAPPPAESATSAVLMTLGAMLTAAAAVCTMLLLFGVAFTREAGLVWLAAFGSSVATAGITWFSTRPRRPRPVPLPLRAH